mmetsp:Transcript_26963/g.71515  ORF Transcript_26963/g.71515 Transcript_26963/m.71515 type:complete len:256 (-) Transcript_26963:136-903(-)
MTFLKTSTAPSTTPTSSAHHFHTPPCSAIIQRQRATPMYAALAAMSARNLAIQTRTSPCLSGCLQQQYSSPMRSTCLLGARSLHCGGTQEFSMEPSAWTRGKAMSPRARNTSALTSSGFFQTSASGSAPAGRRATLSVSRPASGWRASAGPGILENTCVATAPLSVRTSIRSLPSTMRRLHETPGAVTTRESPSIRAMACIGKPFDSITVSWAAPSSGSSWVKVPSAVSAEMVTRPPSKAKECEILPAPQPDEEA